MSVPAVPATTDDDMAPRAAGMLANVAARIEGMAKVDPKLFRVVEVVRDADGRLVHKGQIWHRDLSRARRFGYALAANSRAQRVQIADAAGIILETIPPPAPGTPATGWSAWQNLPLPPMPPRPGASKQAAAAKAPVPPSPAAAAGSAPPSVGKPFTPEEPENDAERTRTLPPV